MRKFTYVLLIFVAGGFAAVAQPRITYKGFLDINTEISQHHFGFNYGGFDNYISAQISDKLSFVGEIIVQPYHDNEFRVDVERIHVTYDVSDYFKLRVGRFYAPIGYYTTHYFSDHAATMTPDAARPMIIAYEDDGGILETRATGVMASGSNITALRLAYDVAVTNGLGSNSLDDNDNNKAVTLRLSMNPVEGLTFGGGAKFDRLDSASVSPYKGEVIGENITSNNYSAFVAYEGHGLLLMGEYYAIMNKSHSMGTKNSKGGFGYLGYTYGKLTPYVQYDYQNVAAGDLYYSKDADKDGFTLGTKFAFTYQSVIKAEYHFDEKILLLQYAIGF